MINITTHIRRSEMATKYYEAICAAAALDNYLDPNEASKISDDYGSDFLTVLKEIKSYRASLPQVEYYQIIDPTNTREFPERYTSREEAVGVATFWEYDLPDLIIVSVKGDNK